MIKYTEKGDGLHAAIRAAGCFLRQENGEWRSSDDAVVQSIIDSYDQLPTLRVARIDAFKADGLVRMNAVFPAIRSLDEVAFYAEFWLSVAPAARVPTTQFKRVIDIYSAAKTAITAVNAASTLAAVNAVQPNWPV